MCSDHLSEQEAEATMCVNVRQGDRSAAVRLQRNVGRGAVAGRCTQCSEATP